MGSLERRLEVLEGRLEPPERPERTEVRERMRIVLDELAAAKREGREPSEEATAVMEAFRERRERDS